MRRLRGNAYARWYQQRAREAIDHARAILSEESALPASLIRGSLIEYHLRAQRAARILSDFIDLAERVRGNGNGNDGQ